jgi:hypothetical protein
VRVLVLGIVAAMAAPARAQPTQKAQDEADLLFEEGRELLSKNQPAKACAKLDQAIRLDPDAEGIMLNLGLCNEQLHKYKKALYWFRKAEQRATEGNTPMPAHERIAKEHAAAIAGKVATITVAFAGDAAPAGASVRIDGELVAPEDYARFEIDPGHHELTATAPGLGGKQPFDVDESGGQRAVTVTFHPEGTPAAHTSTAASSSRKHVALWLGIAGVAAIAAGGGLTYYESRVYARCTTSGALDTTKSSCDHPTDAYAAATEANDARHAARLYGTGLVAVGGAALVVAAYLYVTAPERPAIAPVMTRDHVGIAVMGAL